ncbi:MAG: hypothetical protein WCI88_01805 [Chloroflexota bacterium]
MDTIAVQSLRASVLIFSYVYLGVAAYWVHIHADKKSAIMERLHLILWVLNVIAINTVYFLNYESFFGKEPMLIWQHIIILQMLITSIGTLLAKIVSYLKIDKLKRELLDYASFRD